MSAQLAVGLGLAGAASVGLAAGPLLQHEALATLPPLSRRAPLATLRALLGARGWRRGALLGYGGLALQVAAMALAPLWMVQAVLGAGLVAVVLGWSRRRGAALRARELGGLALLGVAMVALAPSASAARAGVAAGPAALLATGALAGLLALAALRARRPRDPTARLSLAAGAFYAATTIALAAALAGLGGGAGAGATLVVAGVLAPVTAVAGFALFQRALQRGPAPTAIVAMAAVMNGLALLGGLALAGGSAPSPLARGAQLAGLAALAGAGALALGSRAVSPLR